MEIGIRIYMFITQSIPTLCNPMVPLSMEFSRQEYWSGLPFPSPGMWIYTGAKIQRIMHNVSQFFCSDFFLNKKLMMIMADICFPQTRLCKCQTSTVPLFFFAVSHVASGYATCSRSRAKRTLEPCRSDSRTRDLTTVWWCLIWGQERKRITLYLRPWLGGHTSKNQVLFQWEKLSRGGEG